MIALAVEKIVLHIFVQMGLSVELGDYHLFFGGAQCSTGALLAAAHCDRANLAVHLCGSSCLQRMYKVNVTNKEINYNRITSM